MYEEIARLPCEPVRWGLRRTRWRRRRRQAPRQGRRFGSWQAALRPLAEPASAAGMIRSTDVGPSERLLSVCDSSDLVSALAHVRWPLPLLRQWSRCACARASSVDGPVLPGRPAVQREAPARLQGVRGRLDQGSRAPVAAARERDDRRLAGGARAAEPGDARALG